MSGIAVLADAPFALSAETNHDKHKPFGHDDIEKEENLSLAARNGVSWQRLADAAAFAMTIHADQIRKGAETPYIGHLLGVASLVLESGGD